MGQWEAFQIRKLGKKQVLVTGSDARGLAYGLLEISRMIGVSPWEWWADVTPDKRDRFLVSEIKEGQQITGQTDSKNWDIRIISSRWACGANMTEG